MIFEIKKLWRDTFGDSRILFSANYQQNDKWKNHVQFGKLPHGMVLRPIVGLLLNKHLERFLIYKASIHYKLVSGYHKQ